MAASIEALYLARRTLTSYVSHELRSPLTNLRGYLEGIEDDVVEPDAATMGLLRDEVLHLQALVDDLQQLSLAQVGRLRLAPAAVDLGQLVERVAAAHRPDAAASGVSVSAESPVGVVASVDEGRLRQVLTNLVSNAIRHSSPGDAVTVSVRPDGDAVQIDVADTGEGIAADHVDHVFDRFYRADASRARATGGSGLGLAIARELVLAHGGDITVTSQVGVGSTFRIVLPLTVPAT